MKKFYYTVEKELQSYDNESEETTGWKTVWVYDMVNNEPVKFATLELENSDNTIKAIKNHLDENGIVYDVETNFVQL